MMLGKNPGIGPSGCFQNPSCVRPMTVNTAPNAASKSGTICLFKFSFHKYFLLFHLRSRNVSFRISGSAARILFLP